jgi:hypothetical protein
MIYGTRRYQFSQKRYKSTGLKIRSNVPVKAETQKFSLASANKGIHPMHPAEQTQKI